MFDSPHGSAAGDVAVPAAPVVPLTAAGLARVVAQLAVLDREVSDAERIDQIRLLEELKAACAAAQARATADLDTSTRERHAALGLPPARHGAGVAAQVALARRESPTRGTHHLGLAKALVHEMPHTLAALTAGLLTEWRATLLVRETACLTRDHRAAVDVELVADPTRLHGWGDARLVAEAKKAAYRLDPAAALRRSRKAAADRRVTCRPAPDTMAHLSALLPVADAVAVYAALIQHADTHVGTAGESRTRSQIMADTLVERITGRRAGRPARLEVQLVLTDHTLFATGSEPAHLSGYGPVPPGWARDLIARAAAADAAWLRRLYTTPDTGDLVALDARARRFPAALAQFLRLRDGGTCRTPWCDAPIRHHDHVLAHHAGGQTTAANGQGLCAACNYAKQAPGWRAHPRPGPRHTVATTTPTGHTYHSTAPPLPGTDPPVPPSRLEAHFTDLILTA
jgi:Domain of unknown function (DUF222)